MSSGSVEWCERFSVGVTELDEDHKRLIGLIDQLFSAYRDKTLSGEVDSILENLIEYTDAHFKHEEDLLRQHDYPGLHEHEAAHRSLVSALLKIRLDWNDGESESAVLKLAGLLKNWLVEHIVGLDRHYQDHLNQRGLT